MVKYALSCSDCDEGFEAWFSSSSAYDEQKAKGLVTCAYCGSDNVEKQIMAPMVKRTDKAEAPDFTALARKMKSHISKNFDHVGPKFADEARAMFYGDKEHRPIWGQTTPEESAALEEEGVPAAPLPDPLVPDLPKDDGELN